MVEEDCFNSCFGASGADGYAKRDQFASIVTDASTLRKARKLLEIFVILTRYLRHFDRRMRENAFYFPVHASDKRYKICAHLRLPN